jgi:hypothetical protein
MLVINFLLPWLCLALGAWHLGDNADITIEGVQAPSINLMALGKGEEIIIYFSPIFCELLRHP